MGLLTIEGQKRKNPENSSLQLDELVQLTEDGQLYMTEYNDHYVRITERIKVNSAEFYYNHI